MSGGFQADQGILDEISGVLRGATDDLSGVRASAPEAPDGGDAGLALGKLLTNLVEDTDRLVAVTSAAGSAVADGAARYADTDEQAGTDIRNASGTV